MKSAKMTFQLPQIIDGIKAIRMRFNREWGEWQVQFIQADGKVDHDKTYYTDDKQDAIDTAQSIVNSFVKAAEEA